MVEYKNELLTKKSNYLREGKLICILLRKYITKYIVYGYKKIKVHNERIKNVNKFINRLNICL